MRRANAPVEPPPSRGRAGPPRTPDYARNIASLRAVPVIRNRDRCSGGPAGLAQLAMAGTPARTVRDPGPGEACAPGERRAASSSSPAQRLAVRAVRRRDVDVDGDQVGAAGVA